MNPLYRADQVGSFLRPLELLQTRTAYEQGQITPEQLREEEDQAIFKALARQQQAGIHIFSDGEYRRRAFQTSFAECVDGFAPVEASLEQEWHGPGAGIAPTHVRVVSTRLRPLRRLTAHEASFMKRNSPGPFKVTMPTPTMIATSAFKPGVSDGVYATSAELLQDIVQIIRDEIKALADEGATYIQLDSPNYTNYCDETYRKKMVGAGVDPEKSLEEAVAADNACLAGARREGVTLAIHLCRGNRQSRWRKQGGYEPLAERLFNGLEVDRFLLEYDTERAGGFEPLRFMPRGKTVVLGLITTKKGRLESPDLLRRRIDEASRYVPVEHLAISPQCGFASVSEGNLLSWEDQWRKLELVVETARKVWG